MNRNIDIEELKAKARQVRIDIIKMLSAAGSGHPGGALSATELMTVLYFDQLRHNPKEPDWQDRDRVIFSKGHSCPLLYACLAESGYFPKEELLTLRQFGSRLQGHPGKDKGLPGLEVSTGSLGQGLSIGVGMALAGELSQKNFRVYVLLGDGECNCGQIWEAALSAGHYKLNNLCAVVDYNGLQIDGSTEEVMGLEPFVKKWRDFRWQTIEINGHSFKEILNAYKKAKDNKTMPTVIIAHTVKGKGVSFMENKAEWHGDVPNREKTEIALKGLTENG
jgi:transketolase